MNAYVIVLRSRLGTLASAALLPPCLPFAGSQIFIKSHFQIGSFSLSVAVNDCHIHALRRATSKCKLRGTPLSKKRRRDEPGRLRKSLKQFVDISPIVVNGWRDPHQVLI